MSSLKEQIADQIVELESRPWARRALDWLVWSFLAGAVIFAILVAVLRFAVLPRVAEHRGDLEQAISETLHRPVSIGRIEGGWLGIRPRLDLYQLTIADAAGKPALGLDHIEAVVGWTSLLYFRPRLYRLEISAPNLELLRRRDGRLLVAGIEVDNAAEGNGFGDWLLDQVEVAVTDARVTWTDELRGAPPLGLKNVDFRLVNGFRRHRFGLTFDPPAGSARAVDIRGDLHGSDLGDPASWEGSLFARAEAVDLAVWRTWVDYPLELPQGRGGLQLWLDFAEGRATGLVADLALRDTRIRLAPDLPMLDLQRIQGRVEANRLDPGFSAATRQLALATQEGLELRPTDVRIEWQGHEGEFDANLIDLSTLNRLAAYLPLPAAVRMPLTEYAPGGVIRDLRLEWGGEQRDFETFDINARFEQLQLSPRGDIPGFAGISGSVSGDEKSGLLELAGCEAAIDLPAVFAESRIPLTVFDVQAGWKASAEATTFTLGKATFRNADAEGTASGQYVHRRGLPGRIDLSARLARADGTAVWRYMPRVVDPAVAVWLRESILEASAANVTLKLKGDLDRFPFTDKSGTFRVAGSFSKGRLRYAEGWPQAEDIAGTLEFSGPGMVITASSGNILRTPIGPVRAEIADLDQARSIAISGKARGATAGFLKFIEASPVGEGIGHFTADMSASGLGELDLKLDIPLDDSGVARVAGGYRFDGNRLLLAPDLPPIDNVRGRLEFTADSLSARGIQGRLLGGPARADLQTLPDGTVQVTAGGDLVVAQMRQQMPNPVFEHLSGATRWNGTIRVKRGVADVRIASSLQGISSSLAAPLNKSATETMPLVFERKPPEPPKATARRGKESPAAWRDQVSLTLGKAIRLQVQRHAPGVAGAQDRGLIVIGDVAAKLPERGVLMAVNWPHFDADFWRQAMDSGGAEDDADPWVDVSQLDLRAAEVVGFGRLLHDVRITGNHQAGVWDLDLKSREASGRLEWAGARPGRLSGRFTQFALPASRAGTPEPGGKGGNGGNGGDTLKDLPNLDLVFERFAYRDMDLGQVHLVAENRDGFWNTSVDVQNDDANLSAQGKWRRDGAAPDTHFDFRLKARNVERTLNRIGYANAVRRGNATLEGSLSWFGPPYGIDYPTLNGSLRLDAKDGQFNKLEPGVGRLLGIISLQSLPRRISLDFRDIFSEGFAFNTIKVRSTVAKGVIETREPMEIDGPAARILMAGKVDLARETQDMKVRVQPSLGETAATGLLLANPAVGAGAWVLNKLFGNPLDKAFAYDYAITGGWSDPKVEKLGTQAGSAAKEESK